MEGAFTVVDALIACGVNNNVLFMKQTQAQRIASDIFDDTFTSCMDVTFKELDQHFKTYFDLTAAQGQIRLNPGIRKNIKAFVHWARDEIRLGRNPRDTAFPIEQVTDLIRRYHTHEKFKTDLRALAESAKPEKFKEATRWEDWKSTFLNYIWSIPGRNGIPLEYVCSDNDEPTVELNDDFLDDYVAMAPLTGDLFAIDTVQVHTFLVNFVAGNDTAEAKIQGLQRHNDGREAFCRLVEHYEGVGIHAIDIHEADEVIKNLFYAGEKPPHMQWSEFEKRLTHAFNAYVKREGRIVHSNSMRIRMLIDKIKADFLTPTNAQMEIELSRVPMTMMYEQALSLFRNMVNQKLPPQMGAAHNRVRRNINETNAGLGASGQSICGGHGRGGQGGRGSSRNGRGNVRRTRNDSRIITLTDGSQIEYHASFSFPRHVYMKYKAEDKEALRRERAAYNEQRRIGMNSKSFEHKPPRFQCKYLCPTTMFPFHNVLRSVRLQPVNPSWVGGMSKHRTGKIGILPLLHHVDTSHRRHPCYDRLSMIHHQIQQLTTNAIPMWIRAVSAQILLSCNLLTERLMCMHMIHPSNLLRMFRLLPVPPLTTMIL